MELFTLLVPFVVDLAAFSVLNYKHQCNTHCVIVFRYLKRVSYLTLVHSVVYRIIVNITVTTSRAENCGRIVLLSRVNVLIVSWYVREIYLLAFLLKVR